MKNSGHPLSADRRKHSGHPLFVTYTERFGHPLSAAYRPALTCLALLTSTAAWGQSCNYAAPRPPSWQRADTAAVALYLPRDAYAKDLSSAGSSTWRFIADGLEVTLDYGHAAAPQPPDQWTTNRLLGGSPAFLTDEHNARGSGQLEAYWLETGQPGALASLRVAYSDAARREDACRVLSNARLLDRAEALILLRTGITAGQPYALLRETDGTQRRVVVGDYSAAHWGRLTQIGNGSVEITQRFPDGSGGWTERKTVLRRAR